MPDQNLLELTVVTFTANELAIKVKNISGVSLDKRLVIELYPPAYLVDDRINDAAIEAATSQSPPGAKSLAGIVTGPLSWSVWVRREASDSSLIIVFINDMDQNGRDLSAPVKFAAGADFTIRIPLDPAANRDHVDLLYSYQHGRDERDPYFHGKLELTTKTSEELHVTLAVRHDNPTMIKPGDLVKIWWEIKDGVSATLRGPLPGGNSELTLSPNPDADFKISDGEVEVRVMSAMTYLLQAELKRAGQPNVQVTRMLTLDTPNHKYSYVYIHPEKVLPHGLLEINWAAWGVKEVELVVSNLKGTHTTRTIPLTQQTKGRFFEGSGVMRVSASTTAKEEVNLLARPIQKVSTDVIVVSWEQMLKPDLGGRPLAMTILTPKLAVLTIEGVFIADVGEFDPETTLKKLVFKKASNEKPKEWLNLAAADKRFVALRRTSQDDLELAPYKINGAVDDIPPLNLPADVRPLVAREGTTYDFVGFGKRVYVVVEAGWPMGTVRLAYSVGFNSETKKADYRSEPLLEPLSGYRLVCFDDALYALNRTSGRMFRFGLTSAGKLDEPRQAASAIREDGAQKESMVRHGLFVPVGRVLAVLSPSAVPTLKALERFGLHNVLGYLSLAPSPDPNSIPQDLFYNPQKDYWARCGHDLDIQSGAVAAFRATGSRRLWVIQPDGTTHTLAVGSETLFAHDYVSDVPTAALPTYLNKKRKFKVTNNTGIRLLQISNDYGNAGLTDFSADGPAELIDFFPDGLRVGASETFEFRYNEADPVPIRLRFQIDRLPALRHQYFIELTFSGPDLSTATSVFKRIAGNSIAEIPGTTVQYSTGNPIELRLPRVLVEGVRVRLHNATTYQLWLSAPWKADSRDREQPYSGDIRISWDTGDFAVFAWDAGGLQFNVDLTLPPGIEISTGNEPQRKRIRIDTGTSKGLTAEILPQNEENLYECMVRYVRKEKLPGVYLGDGVATSNGDRIFLPVARPDNEMQNLVLRINPDDLRISAGVELPGTGVFSLPNEVQLTDEFVMAAFGDTRQHLMDLSLQGQIVHLDPYTLVSAIKAHYDRDCCLIVMIDDKQSSPPAIRYHYGLVRRFVGLDHARRLVVSDPVQISLDAVKGFREQSRMPGFPTWVSSSPPPMALSPSPVSTRGERSREVAICIAGGLFVVGGNQRTIRELALEAAGREEAIVYGKEGLEIFCAHSQSDTEGLRISRIDNKAWKQTHSLSLPRGEDVADLTRDTRQRTATDVFKSARAASMVVTFDSKLLFVSHGRSIFKIDALTLTLLDVFKVDLPCRVFHTWWGKPTEFPHLVYGSPASCTLLYAIGSTYTGDGARAKANEFKTELYKLAIPD
jgi:hypothetical protein